MNFSFESFIDGDFDYDPATRQHTGLWLRDQNMDIGGGKITKRDIDRLRFYPDTDTVTISGLRQDTFEYFIRTYGHQLKAIRFFKNKLVEDWSLLGTLPGLEYVHYFANQRIDRLWDMRGNTALTALSISDFTRLHSIEGIGAAPALREFHIGDAIWRKAVVNSLMPLANTGIEVLSFGAKELTDDNLSFLCTMNNLKEFDFSTNQFTTEQVAWIAGNFPALQGFALAAKRDIEPMQYADEEPYTLIIGKRKPCLKIRGNEARIAKYEENFEALKQKYKGMPYEAAFPQA